MSLISGQFLGVTILVLAMTTMTTVLVMNAHFRGLRGHRPPAWVRKLFLDWFARFVCMRKVTSTSRLFYKQFSSVSYNFPTRRKRTLATNNVMFFNHAFKEKFFFAFLYLLSYVRMIFDDCLYISSVDIICLCEFKVSDRQIDSRETATEESDALLNMCCEFILLDTDQSCNVRWFPTRTNLESRVAFIGATIVE